MNKIMPFWDHVYELRNRLLVVIGSMIPFSVAGYYLFPFFVGVLQRIIGEDLYATNIAEGFVARMKLSILFGAFLSLPILIIELLLFIFPALTKRQKVQLVVTLSITFGLFLAGVVFAFEEVLPISISFLKSETFFPSNVNRLVSYTAFIQFVFQFLLGFGIFFQFPVVLVALMKLGILEPEFLVRNVKIFVPVIFMISAILTPPDVVSQIMLATPTTILYLVCILIGKVFHLGYEHVRDRAR